MSDDNEENNVLRYEESLPSESDDIDDENELNKNETQLDDETQSIQLRILSAAERGDKRKLIELLKLNDYDVNDIRDSDQYTPLHRAAYNNHCDIIKLLLNKGFNVNSLTADGWTPLHCACKWSNVEACSLLLENGANVNAQTNGGHTALHLAVNNKNRCLIELLIYHPDIDINIRNSVGETAYEIATRKSVLYQLFYQFIDISLIEKFSSKM